MRWDVQSDAGTAIDGVFQNQQASFTIKKMESISCIFKSESFFEQTFDFRWKSRSGVEHVNDNMGLFKSRRDFEFSSLRMRSDAVPDGVFHDGL